MNAISPALIGPGFMWTRQNELHAASGSPYFSSNAEDVAKAKIAGYDTTCFVISISIDVYTNFFY